MGRTLENVLGAHHGCVLGGHQRRARPGQATWTGMGWLQALASLDLVGHRPPLAAPSLLGILAGRDLAVKLGLTFGDVLPIAAGWPPVAPPPVHHRGRPLRELLLAGICDFW